VHSLAEGVAMGASLYMQYNGKKGSSVGLVVALAIFIHKAPEALGFGTFLHHKGASSKELLMHLTIYCATSPIFALVAYIVLVHSTKNLDPDSKAL